MKQLWIILGFVILWAPAQSQAQEQQRGFAKRVIVGTSLTYIPNSDEPNTNFTLHELTWSANASISVTKKIHVGWSYMHIYTSGSLTGLNIEPETYFTTGVFGQYDFCSTRNCASMGNFLMILEIIVPVIFLDLNRAKLKV